jgi:hypothetical protein
LCLLELRSIPEISRPLSCGLVHMDGKESKCPFGALRLQWCKQRI